MAVRPGHARHDQPSELAQFQPQSLRRCCRQDREDQMIYAFLVICPIAAYFIFTKLANFIVRKFERAQ
jgi:hypothetical protein